MVRAHIRPHRLSPPCRPSPVPNRIHWASHALASDKRHIAKGSRAKIALCRVEVAMALKTIQDGPVPPIDLYCSTVATESRSPATYIKATTTTPHPLVWIIPTAPMMESRVGALDNAKLP